MYIHVEEDESKNDSSSRMDKCWLFNGVFVGSDLVVSSLFVGRIPEGQV